MRVNKTRQNEFSISQFSHDDMDVTARESLDRRNSLVTVTLNGGCIPIRERDGLVRGSGVALLEARLGWLHKKRDGGVTRSVLPFFDGGGGGLRGGCLSSRAYGLRIDLRRSGRGGVTALRLCLMAALGTAVLRDVASLR